MEPGDFFEIVQSDCWQVLWIHNLVDVLVYCGPAVIDGLLDGVDDSLHVERAVLAHLEAKVIEFFEDQ